MRRLFSLVLVLVLSAPAWAQNGLNRWDARPVPIPKPAVSAAQRSKQLAQAKSSRDSLGRVQMLRRDSLRIAARAAAAPVLQRGIGQRLKAKNAMPEDNKYYEYIRTSIRYPVMALRYLVEGDITMELTIDATGQVTAVKELANTIPPGAADRDVMVQQVRLLLAQLHFEPASTTTEEEITVRYAFQ
ncbi:hypothetical protein LGH70_05910 [Hymenobacter sp. BT635]|uniref:TonB C-terminal domain-containing protein n=1 Tax=Hymenobacter nitidus TaxID=2880929 RepID=A0ABS8AAZ1_9BACT|nr:hypothetical protein [Hymenobacter nitidus]MCB2377107.1 hypothetical protein [Hymenobacter nitidus]